MFCAPVDAAPFRSSVIPKVVNDPAGAGHSTATRHAASTHWSSTCPSSESTAFRVSIDGYGAGPDQSLENPLGVGGMALHEWVFATRTFRQMLGSRRRHDRRRRRLRRARLRQHRRLDPRAQHVRPGARAVARRQLEGLVGRQSAVPHAGLRADPSPARTARDGGRHDVPLRHRRHPGRARSAPGRRPAAATCGSAAASRRSGSTCAPA